MLEQIKELLANELRIPKEKITDDAAIIEDLGADSLDVVEMLMSLEETFSITVPDEDVVQLKTVRSVAEYIEKKTK
ncbi:MAG: acyl carrier protein [Clostridia bacterium]|nr:acyl carrier protein [Clostridia bacterium]MBQ2731374.1 acyl carrier protein [Clostridia bacterium]